MHYKAPQDTETEMPFVDDVDSPEVLLEWQHKAALGPLHAEPIHAYAGRLVAGTGVGRPAELRAFELARCALPPLRGAVSSLRSAWLSSTR